MARTVICQITGISRATRLTRCTPLTAMVMAAFLVALSAREVRAADTRALAFVQAPAGSARGAGGEMGNTLLSGRYLQGMRIVLAASDGSRRSVATEGFLCATDPCFLPDGTGVLFSGKRSEGEHLQIWQVSTDGAAPELRFDCPADCVQPLYLPNGHVVFASLLSGEYEEHGGRYSFSLYEWAPDGGAPVRLTFNPSSEFDPTLLLDGRLLFSSWQHVGNHYWPTGNVALFLTNWDGTGIFPATGNHRGPWFKRGAVQLDADVIAFVQSDGPGGLGAGALVSTNLNNLFAEYELMLEPGAWHVSDVAAAPDGGVIVSARPATDTDASWGLYHRDGDRLRALYDHPDQHELSPVMHLPQRRPDTRFSTVVPGTAYGYVLVLNALESDRDGAAALNGASVGALRVIEGMPLADDGDRRPEFSTLPGREDEPMVSSSSATGYIPSRILGEVPLAADGSVYLKVPADRPLRLQLVDKNGFAVVNERAWFWVRPNERRVCIGCHENREMSPANSTPQAASHVPTDLTDPDAWVTVSFREDVAPIIRASCAVTDCHLPPRPTAGMNFKGDELCDRDTELAGRFGPPYANLLAPQEGKPFGVGGRRVHPGNARQSPLLWMLYGRNLGPQYAPAPFDLPIRESHPGPMLAADYLTAIRRWIDLGAVYDDWRGQGGWPFESAPVASDAGTAEGGAAQ